MGTLLAVGDHTMLYDHEGALEFWDPGAWNGEEFGRWSSFWGHEALGSPGHPPISVRACCECGWRGVPLPWTKDADYPTEEQHDTLMAVWYHEHAHPLRIKALADDEGPDCLGPEGNCIDTHVPPCPLATESG